MPSHSFSLGEPTEPQLLGWPEIRQGRDVLISAPTGSGKTLAAFLSAIDLLAARAQSGALPEQTEVLYVSPLKALSNDVHKNLDIPLAGIAALAAERGVPLAPIRTALRTGDTPQWERQQLTRNRPHILVTTPESLYILLTAARPREMLRHVRTVIVDEIHAVADDKRGSHLALSLARLDRLVEQSGGARPQRIGLSATVKPIEEVAAYLSRQRPHRQHRPSPRHGPRRRSSAATSWAPWPPTKCGARSTTAPPPSFARTAPRWSSSTRGASPSASPITSPSALAKTPSCPITAAFRAPCAWRPSGASRAASCAP